MDPTTLAALVATFFLQHPVTPSSGIEESVSPEVAISRQENFAELSKAIVLCYHESARNPRGEVLQRPWRRQDQPRVNDSALIVITFFGAFTGRQYEMRVALLARSQPRQVRAAVQSDNAPFNPNRRCPLDHWVDLQP